MPLQPRDRLVALPPSPCMGSNPKAAHLSGMNVEGPQIFSFVLMGLLAGLPGILYASRIGPRLPLLASEHNCRPQRWLANLAAGRGRGTSPKDNRVAGLWWLRRLYHGRVGKYCHPETALLQHLKMLRECVQDLASKGRIEPGIIVQLFGGLRENLQKH
jgi:Branched-chain amino acid transport system / permease component